MKGVWALGALLAVPALSAQAQTPFSQVRCVELLREAVPRNSTAAKTRADEKKLEAQEGSITELRKTCPLGSGGQCVFPVPEVTVLAGEKDGRAILRYGAQQVAPSDKTTWAFEASVPFDEEDEEGVFASLKEVNGDITLTGEAGYVSWRPFEYERYISALCSACEQAKVINLNDCSPEGLSEILKATGKTQRQVDRQTLAISDAGFGWFVGTAFGGKVMAGRKEREFFDADAKVAEDDRVGFSAGVTGTFFLRNGTAGFQLLQKREFEEAKGATLCTPIAEGSLLDECQTKPRSRADSVDSLVGSIEWKIALTNLALVPQLQHDFDEGLWAAQLPIYLVRNDEGQLTGGLRLGWRSDTDDFYAAIFVAQPLKF
jgi:hypothetical protein